jgi:hypothetical protein
MNNNAVELSIFVSLTLSGIESSIVYTLLY